MVDLEQSVRFSVETATGLLLTSGGQHCLLSIRDLQRNVRANV